MDVSVIIINYRTAELTIQCIESLYREVQDIIFEVIVVDNASGDGSLKKIQAFFKNQIRIVDSFENLGFGNGNNLGAKEASGRYLFFLNPDTLLINNAVKLLMDYLDQNAQVGIVGGNLYTMEGGAAPSYCLTFDSPKQEKKDSRWISILGSKIKSKLKTFNKNGFADSFNISDDPLSVAYIFGADLMIRRELFEELGGFDPEFFMYAEEEELSWRVKERGFAIMNVPQAKIIHLEGASTQSDVTFNQRQYCMRMNGKLIFFRKCYGLEGMESFYRFRKRFYQRNIQFQKMKGKDPDKTLASLQMKTLEQEYLKYKELLDNKKTWQK